MRNQYHIATAYNQEEIEWARMESAHAKEQQKPGVVAFKCKLALCTHIPCAEKQHSAAPDTGLSFYVYSPGEPLVDLARDFDSAAQLRFCRSANRVTKSALE